MRDINILEERLINSAGLVVIGLTVLLFTLCMAVSIMTLWTSEGHAERRLFAYNTPVHSERTYALPRIMC